MKALPTSNSNNKRFRNPNIDFLRISGMIAIVIDHLLYHAGGFKKFKYQELQLLNIICMWHVCSFGLVSGLVGNKTHKYSNLLYLWILVVFYSFLFYIKFNPLKNLLLNKVIKANLFPVISCNYWYFTSYFGVYPFLPFINESISILDKIIFKKSIYFMLGIFIIWSSYFQDQFLQNKGHSTFSLLIFYIFGAYIRKYIFYKKNSIIWRILLCILCFIIFIMISMFCYKVNILNSNPKTDSSLQKIFKIEINSFPMVIQTFSIIIFISQINFPKYISKIITFIGPLTFDVYLIHENNYVRSSYIKYALNSITNNINLFSVLCLIIKKAFYIFFICIFFAYIRSIIFRILKIKNICLYIEIFANKVLNFMI